MGAQGVDKRMINGQYYYYIKSNHGIVRSLFRLGLGGGGRVVVRVGGWGVGGAWGGGREVAHSTHWDSFIHSFIHEAYLIDR